MRKVAEWNGSSDDQAIPKRVKLRVWLRCEGKCALTGKKLGPGDAHDFDHIIPLVLGGRHAESNLQLVSRDAHKAKTVDDVKAKSKVARLHAKHFGYWAKGPFRIRSRGFQRRLPPEGK